MMTYLKMFVLLSVYITTVDFTNPQKKNLADAAQQAKDSSVATIHVTRPGFKKDFHFSSADGPNGCIGTSDVNFPQSQDTSERSVQIGGDGTDGVSRFLISLNNMKAGHSILPMIQAKLGEYFLAHPNEPYMLSFQLQYISKTGGLFPGSQNNLESINAGTSWDEVRNTGSLTISQYNGVGSHMKGSFAFKIWVQTQWGHQGLEHGKEGFYDVTGNFDVKINKD